VTGGRLSIGSTMSNPEKPISYRPSSFYWRKKIRGESDIEALRVVALQLVSELEVHKAFIRGKGFWPPKTAVTAEEAKAKKLS
jgi:hypothetical protein